MSGISSAERRGGCQNRSHLGEIRVDLQLPEFSSPESGRRLKECQIPIHHEVILLLRVAAGAVLVIGRPDAGVVCQHVQAQLMAIRPVDGSCQRAVGTR